MSVLMMLQGKEKRKQIVSTTPGRLLLWMICPEHEAIGFDLVNRTLSSKELR